MGFIRGSMIVILPELGSLLPMTILVFFTGQEPCG